MLLDLFLVVVPRARNGEREDKLRSYAGPNKNPGPGQPSLEKVRKEEEGPRLRSYINFNLSVSDSSSLSFTFPGPGVSGVADIVLSFQSANRQTARPGK